MSRTAILLGSKPASVVALQIMLKHGWDVKEVVASPEQASWLPRPSLYEIANKLGIRVVSDQSEIQSTSVDLVISYMSRYLVKTNTLERGKHALNFHAGPLPEFGGWAFYNVAILEDSTEYGCTCHIMDENFDTGPLVKVRRFSINPQRETALSLEKKAQTEMILLFREIISSYEVHGSIESNKQNPIQMRYMSAKQFQRLKEISLDCSPAEADKIARAFWYPPYEMAYIRMPNGEKLEVIPEVAKETIAHDQHSDDLEQLLRVVGLSGSDIS